MAIRRLLLAAQFGAMFSQIAEASRPIAHKFDVAAFWKHSTQIFEIDELMAKLACCASALHIGKYADSVKKMHEVIIMDCRNCTLDVHFYFLSLTGKPALSIIYLLQ